MRCLWQQVFDGYPHAFFPRPLPGRPLGFPVWFDRDLQASRFHFLFAYVASSGYVTRSRIAGPDVLTVEVCPSLSQRLTGRSPGSPKIPLPPLRWKSGADRAVHRLAIRPACSLAMGLSRESATGLTPGRTAPHCQRSQTWAEGAALTGRVPGDADSDSVAARREHWPRHADDALGAIRRHPDSDGGAGREHRKRPQHFLGRGHQHDFRALFCLLHRVRDQEGLGSSEDQERTAEKGGIVWPVCPAPQERAKWKGREESQTAAVPSGDARPRLPSSREGGGGGPPSGCCIRAASIRCAGRDVLRG